jgi:hypothetical protein
MSSLRTATLTLFFALLAGAPALAQTPADKEGVRQAVLDYVEGFYEGDTTRFLRSVRPEVDKYGFSRTKAGSYEGSAFPSANFGSFAARVKSGKIKTPANAPKLITVLDVQDQTAAAKLTAYWGTDHFLLAKYDGKWMIRHIIWQELPKP